MKLLQRWLKRAGNFGLILMMVVSTNACSDSWKEEVLLHDGSRIIVKRSVDRGGRHEIGQRPPIKEQHLSFVSPSTKQMVTWSDNYSEDIRAASFLPMQLEIFDGIHYLVASPMGCLSYNKWGRPNPPYVIFKYNGKAWQRVDLQELPAESKIPNLVISSPDDAAKEVVHGVVSAEKIKKLNSSFRQPEFKTILREQLPSWGMDCLEEIHNGKGTWLSIDWFSQQPTYEFCKKVCDREQYDNHHCPCDKLFRKE